MLRQFLGAELTRQGRGKQFSKIGRGPKLMSRDNCDESAIFDTKIRSAPSTPRTADAILLLFGQDDFQCQSRMWKDADKMNQVFKEIQDCFARRAVTG